jgi:hypothetical protein
MEQILPAKGWQQGFVAEWDKEQAFFPREVKGNAGSKTT